MKLQILICILLGSFLSSCAKSTLVLSDEIHEVSLISILSNPEKYDGKYVMVAGFVRIAFEGNAIYFHREDCVTELTKNALWLNGDFLNTVNAKQLDMKYTMIAGRFNAKNKGHMDLFSGALEDVSIPNGGRRKMP